eukprot:1780488-Rhodomonas_salina.1
MATTSESREVTVRAYSARTVTSPFHSWSCAGPRSASHMSVRPWSSRLQCTHRDQFVGYKVWERTLVLM